MRALVDTNVWLDVFLVREPFADASGRAISLLDAPEHGLFVGATTVTTIFYLVEKIRGRKTARAKVRAMLDRAGVAGVDGGVHRVAVNSQPESTHTRISRSSKLDSSSQA